MISLAPTSPRPRRTAGRRWRTSASAALATVVAVLAGCGGAAATKPAPGSPGQASTGGTGAIPTAVRSDEGLAFALLGHLGQGSGNVVFSPYSIESALSMVDAGAAGSTASEIDHVLHTDRPKTVAAGLAAIDARLTGSAKAPRLEIANSLWVQSGLALKKPFTRTLASLFGAAPQPVDFAGAPESARQEINSWVATHTGEKITDLFPTGSITPQTAAVLANAIYLAARWANPFTVALTAPGPFYPGAGPAVQVPFMTQTPVALPYARQRGSYQAVDLPYKYSTLSMLLVMPAPGTLASFERGLTPASLARLERALASRRLDLHVPKFHLTFDTELSPVLSALGMPVAFSDAADFSGITARTSLKISAVEHAADLQVDEAGTVAAAATGIGLEPTAVAPEPATSLTIDHPFLALLRDDATGAILFVAQVTNPA
jgi:serpin B